MRARWFLHVAVLLMPLLGWGGQPAWGEQLASVVYTARDGLAGDYTQSAFQDSRGFLWIATASGVCRFDGHRFITYTTRDGLPHPGATRVIETPDGTMWVGTAGGLAWLPPHRAAGRALFGALQFGPSTLDNIVRDMVLDKSGRLLVAAGGALWRVTPPADSAPQLERVLVGARLPASDQDVRCLAWAPDGSLWLGTAAGLVRMLPDGGEMVYHLSSDAHTSGITAVALDRSGRIWALGQGVVVFVAEPADAAAGSTLALRARHVRSTATVELPERPGEALYLGREAGVGTSGTGSVLVTRDGGVWITTDHGLLVVAEQRLHRYTKAALWLTDALTSAFEDRDGDVWVGTEGHGLIEVLRSGFSWYGVADGLPSKHAAGICEDGEGRAVVEGYPPGNGLFVISAGRFLRINVPIPAAAFAGAWGWNDAVLRDHRGDWWFPTNAGIYRFAVAGRLEGVAATRPRNVYDRRHGLASNEVFRLFEDSRGDVWIGLFGTTRMARWRRASGAFQAWRSDDATVPFDTPTAFAEDRAGNIWAGFYRGGLVRFHDGTAHRCFVGPPPGFVNDLLVDRRGRLWVGTTIGLGRCDDPAADTPVWHRYTLPTGPNFGAVNTIAEDRFGRIYVGGYNGLDRLSPDDGSVEHFDTTSGLLNNVVFTSSTDRHGDIWLATAAGVGRYHPSAAQPTAPPPTLIYRVRIDGVPLPLPELGLSRLDLGRLGRPGASLDVDFGAVNFLPGRHISFHYAFARDERWSEPLAEPSLHLAELAAGTNALRVCARVAGAPLGVPATLRFVVPPPLWQSWWFAAALATLLLGAGFAVYRNRMRHILAVQQTRRRIARDLHDELGLSLSRISILSEVAARRTTGSGPRQELTEIGATARELIDATADMVWALDSRHADLESLLARLRRLAGDVLDESGLQWRFHTPSSDGVQLGAEQRRHLYLVLKEAINNAARHSHGSMVTVAVDIAEGVLRATVSDDGVGMPVGDALSPEDSQAGHGLQNMARRVKELGGTLAVRSRPGGGTTVEVTLALVGGRPWSTPATRKPTGGKAVP